MYEPFVQLCWPRTILSKDEIDHLNTVKVLRAGSTEKSAICRMSLIDSLQKIQGNRKPPSFSNEEQTESVHWSVSESDAIHVFRTTALILRRDGLQVTEDHVPYNVHSKNKQILPMAILDKNSEEVGKYI